MFSDTAFLNLNISSSDGTFRGTCSFHAEGEKYAEAAPIFSGTQRRRPIVVWRMSFGSEASRKEERIRHGRMKGGSAA